MSSYFDVENLPAEFGGKASIEYDHEEFSKMMAKDDIKTAQFWGIENKESGEHMPDKKKFVSELDRVAAPGATIIIVTWYKKMEACITPLPVVVAGEQLKPFPQRLYAVPPRIASGFVAGVTEEAYSKDSKTWKKRVSAYKRVNKLIDTGRYRNIMDMNAELGGFAAAIQSSLFGTSCFAY